MELVCDWNQQSVTDSLVTRIHTRSYSKKIEISSLFSEIMERPSSRSLLVSDDSSDSSSDEAVILLYFHRYRRERIWRRFWVHPYLERNFHRRLFVAAKELEVSDAKFLAFHRMSKESYLELVQIISPVIQKQNTIMRECVDAEEQILITLR